MKYGYFDNENREYVITNPATPAPWVNYLGSPEYGAIISNNAGGYSFAKSGAKASTHQLTGGRQEQIRFVNVDFSTCLLSERRLSFVDQSDLLEKHVAECEATGS